jgi:hypothetical protein
VFAEVAAHGPGRIFVDDIARRTGLARVQVFRAMYRALHLTPTPLPGLTRIGEGVWEYDPPAPGSTPSPNGTAPTLTGCMFETLAELPNGEGVILRERRPVPGRQTPVSRDEAIAAAAQRGRSFDPTLTPTEAAAVERFAMHLLVMTAATPRRDAA